MTSVKFTTLIKKFDRQGEKTGWTYFEIAADFAQKINAGVKTSYRVKGKLDEHKIKAVAILPMGEGNFIMPLNAAMRKAIGKRSGYSLTVQLELDSDEFKFSQDFIECLQDEPKALKHFQSLTGSHQRYFSKWIDDAKTIDTKTKRIALSIKALAQKQGYPEMIRANKKT
ncbi:MAG: DUF1905 domain-containing protein [Fimbriimonadaceae bacterium]|nr:DUF1905 domain-containing protein [Chitinophagales bacterium]